MGDPSGACRDVSGQKMLESEPLPTAWLLCEGFCAAADVDDGADN